MDAFNTCQEVLALSPKEFDVWLEKFEEEIVMEPMDIEKCPWILLPTSCKLNGLDIEPASTTSVPVKWAIGAMSIYVFGYDGKDTVSAYTTLDRTNEPELATFKISQANEVFLVTDSDECLRIYRDTAWTPKTLGEIFPMLFVDLHPNNEELIF